MYKNLFITLICFFVGYFIISKCIESIQAKKRESKEEYERNQKNDNQRRSYEVNDDEVERHAAILGVDVHSTEEQIKKAYYSKISEYHPDRLEGLGKELVELANRKSQEINAAYAFFKKRFEFR